MISITRRISALRTATRVVAAIDSDRLRADYYCDGVADEVEINQAIASLPASGGKVLLLNGTFTIDNQILINKDNVTLQGMGFSTVIFLSASFFWPAGIFINRWPEITWNILIKDLKIDINAANHTGQSIGGIYGLLMRRSRIEGVWITPPSEEDLINGGIGIDIYDLYYSGGNIIKNCIIEIQGVLASTTAIRIIGLSNNIIKNNFIEGNNGVGIWLTGGMNEITGNNISIGGFFSYTILLYDNQSIIIGNIIKSSVSWWIANGISIIFAEENILKGNIIDGGEHGIELDSIAPNRSRRNLLCSNRILNANRGIFSDSLSIGNLITGNILLENTTPLVDLNDNEIFNNIE